MICRTPMAYQDYRLVLSDSAPRCSGCISLGVTPTHNENSKSWFACEVTNYGNAEIILRNENFLQRVAEFLVRGSGRTSCAVPTGLDFIFTLTPGLRPGLTSGRAYGAWSFVIGDESRARIDSTRKIHRSFDCVVACAPIALRMTRGELAENSLRRHFCNPHSRDVSTTSRDCSRGSTLNMTGIGGLAYHV